MILLTIALTLGVMFLITCVVMMIKLPRMGLSENMDPSDMYAVIAESMSGTAFICTYVPLLLGGVASILIARFCKPGKPREGQQFGPNAYGQQNQQFGPNVYGQQNQQFGPNTYGQQNQQFGPNGYSQQAQQPGQNDQAGPNGSDQQRIRYTQQFEEGRAYDAEEMLTEPCTICIIREGTVQKSDELFTVSLNGYPACRLMNNSYVNIMTNRKQNTVTGRDGTGNSLKKPVSFMAVDSGYVELRIRGDSFIPEKTIGRRPKGNPAAEEEKKSEDEIVL